MRRILYGMISVLIIFSLAIPFSQTMLEASGGFAGGAGTAGNPYQIATWHHLHSVRDHLGAHFVLVNDLDSYTDGYDVLAGPAANGGVGWLPIGTEASPFGGTFDGRGRVISGLFIDGGADYVGLFGVLGPGGAIESVGVEDFSVAGMNYVGGLVGWSRGVIRNCHASGDVNATFDDVGGLVGWNEGKLDGCYASGSVNGDWYVGGLVGFNEGEVSNSYATGVVGGVFHVGGLVGKNEGEVSSCYATGSVTGTDNIGGLVGWNSATGTLCDCYATGSVAGENEIGGLVGWNQGAVRNCYSTGTANASVGGVGGLVGFNDGTVTNCFWDMATSGVNVSSGGTGKTTTAMQSLDTFTSQGSGGLMWPWDMLSVAPGATVPYSIWNIADGDGYPFLTFGRVEIEVKAGWNMVSAPSGTAGGPKTVPEVFGSQIVAIYLWNPVSKSYEVPTHVEPNRGYWVAVTEDKTLTLRL